MGWTTPRTWVSGEVVTDTLLNTHLRDNLNALYPLICSQVLSGSQASFDTNTILSGNIPSTYSHLRLIWGGRSTGASTYTNLLVNNDTTAGNYNESAVQISGSTVTGTSAGAGSSGLRVGFQTGSSDAAGASASGTIDIAAYTGTTFWKNVIAANSAVAQGAGTFYGQYRGTGAITRLTLTPDTGSFATGSFFYLYGVM